jgi:hypothetical protein
VYKFGYILQVVRFQRVEIFIGKLLNTAHDNLSAMNTEYLRKIGVNLTMEVAGSSGICHITRSHNSEGNNLKRLEFSCLFTQDLYIDL